MKPARRHYKLNDAVIKKVRFLCEYGAPLEHIAPAVGVTYESIRQWLANAKGPDPTDLEIALSVAINEGRAAGGLRLASKIAESADAGDTRDAQWLLTHSPAFRRHYSDNAAVTRAFSDGVQACVAAVQAAGLTPEQERAVLLQISARTGEKLVETD
ncbi:MAG: hypothetical protein EBR30_30680 [Cytophagia bacterium]|nr:hypothetical protein [Cytophagia bacterium]